MVMLTIPVWKALATVLISSDDFETTSIFLRFTVNGISSTILSVYSLSLCLHVFAYFISILETEFQQEILSTLGLGLV